MRSPTDDRFQVLAARCLCSATQRAVHLLQVNHGGCAETYGGCLQMAEELQHPPALGCKLKASYHHLHGLTVRRVQTYPASLVCSTISCPYTGCTQSVSLT